MHRDIKPDNLLIARPLDGPQQLSADEIKVSDFGISVPLTPGQVRGAGGDSSCCRRVCDGWCVYTRVWLCVE